MKTGFLSISFHGPLLIIIGLLFMLSLSLALYQSRREKNSLQEALELVEETLEAEREKIQLKEDSLESVIRDQKIRNISLKEELETLEKRKRMFNSEADEKKNALRLIRDVDSLQREIARHYRP